MMPPMSLPNHQVRRATIDDLPKLGPLWAREDLPVHELEKRFKEFQVAEAENGELIGALGVKVNGLQGLVHSEAFLHPEQADFLRERLWERSLVVIRNHGLVRVWTQCCCPFWHTNGFREAPPELLEQLPADFASDLRPWLFLQLREALPTTLSLDKEFALFKEAEQESTQRLLRHAKIMKMVAATIAVILLGLVILWAVLFFRTPLFRR